MGSVGSIWSLGSVVGPFFLSFPVSVSPVPVPLVTAMMSISSEAREEETKMYGLSGWTHFSLQFIGQVIKDSFSLLFRSSFRT